MHLKHDFEDAIRKQLNNTSFIKIKTIEDLWSKHVDFKFDHNLWMDLFVEDLIINNQNKTSISFSDSILELYNVLDKFFYKNIISSKEVQEQDAKCEEKIIAIFDYYKKDPAKLWKKYALGSLLEQQARYVEERYGFDQVVVDYIQWLSDERANEEYKKIAKSN